MDTSSSNPLDEASEEVRDIVIKTLEIEKSQLHLTKTHNIVPQIVSMIKEVIK